jgi:hypothetical protein
LNQIKLPQLLAEEIDSTSTSYVDEADNKIDTDDLKQGIDTDSHATKVNLSLNLCAPASLQFNDNIYSSSNNNVYVDLGLYAPTYPSSKNVMLSDYIEA